MGDTETTAPTRKPRASAVVVGDGPGDIAHAREAARAFADGLDPAPTPESAETLALVVSELATNALRHGGGHYTLELAAGTDAVHIAVSDPNPAHPRDRTPGLVGGTGGFGWPMVRHLADTVAITPGSGQGKTIHIRLPR